MDKRIKVTVTGSILNIFLSAIKLTAGFLGNSYGLIADGIHSLSDLVTDILVVFGILIGKKPPDEGHHYGHKKLENIAEVLMGLILIILSIKLSVSSFKILLSGKVYTPAFYTIFIAIISVIIKEYLYRVTNKIAKECNSDVLLGNAWHHRSDALTSVIIVFSLGIGIYFPKFYFIDAIISIMISIIIMYLGIKITMRSLNKLSDAAPPEGYRNNVEQEIELIEGVGNVHGLRMRFLGSQIYIECPVEVDPDISVSLGHDIATEIKDHLMVWDKNIVEVMVHIEPLGDHLKIHNSDFK
ncbi:cation transporter [Candidatus Dependentiae bacterium]|nr:cation transporter [Candidatus Dependentiae bacterium]